MAQDDCLPPPPGSVKRALPSSCCILQNAVPAGFLAATQNCRSQFPRPPRPPGPPTSGEIPKEFKDHHACMAQCIFTKNKMVNGEKIMIQDDVKKTFTSSDTTFRPLVEAAVTKCLSSYKNDIDQSLNCTSGAAELERCVLREVFLNCPTSSWTSSADCDDLKARMVKCPNMPVKLMGGYHRERPR